MYELVRPRFAVPVHGEIHHLEAHARLARGCGVERALVPEDGDMIRLAQSNTSVIGHIEPHRLVNDGQFLLPWAGSIEATFGIRAEQRAERQTADSAFAA
jgi:ribonuclease J